MVWMVRPSITPIHSPGVSALESFSKAFDPPHGMGFYDEVVLPLREGRPLDHPERVPTVGVLRKPMKRFSAVMACSTNWASRRT